MQTLLIAVYLGSVVGLIYAYVGYPVIISFLAKRWGVEPPVSLSDEDEVLPAITVLIAAHNAESYLAERLENIFASDYPADLIRVVVASDGSTDKTAQVAASCLLGDVRTIAYSQRRGKAATLIDAVNSVSTSVIVFTDATTRFSQHALREAAKHFADPSVGVVAGKVTMVDEHGRASESLYWKVENLIRRSEASLGLSMGASGAIYAIRRSLFVAPSRPTINDDLVIPMLARLTHRCRVVFEPNANAFISCTGGMRTEFLRRQRIGLGAFQCLTTLRSLLSWSNRWYTAAFASHKLMRWIGPFLLVAAAISNLLLTSVFAFQLLGGVQVACYLAACWGLKTKRRGRLAGLARAGASFVVMNAAIGYGICRWMVGADIVIWNPTERTTWSQIPAASQLIPATEKRAA
ncbi:glycosyltransferase family 2 protein [Stieleria sp. JC731]|uniref:glycosyltransferase family 2 protein n=1 Tax=Pirellulaceae TaxID=2691357 RepID=UPI001E451EA1|nr:glycosyltransferase family 2 protein [Stieleria sp. JC731]MCC9599520.1 glycosyltransferase family 2 protein [Stieleria sp. JC731]